MSQPFDRFMVAVDVGTNRKLRRLPVAQRWVYVAGVLALAAQSPWRGALLIALDEPATDDDVALQATVPVKDARAALTALRGLGMLERDEDGVEWVRDWDKMNPEPRASDSAEATRERKRLQRERARQAAASRAGHADVTRDPQAESRDTVRDVTRDLAVGHGPEVEVEVEEEEQPPLPPEGGRARDRSTWEAEMVAWSQRHFPGVNADLVKALAGWLRGRGAPLTAAAMRAYAAEHEQWSDVLAVEEAVAS